MVHRLGVKPSILTGNELGALRSSSTHLWNVTWISQHTGVEQKRRSATALWRRQAGKVRQEYLKQHKREGFGLCIIAEAKCCGLKSLVYSLYKFKEIINYLYSAVIIIMVITIPAWIFGMVVCKLKRQNHPPTTYTLWNKQTSSGEVPVVRWWGQIIKILSWIFGMAVCK